MAASTGEALKRWRERADLTREQVAAVAGVSRQTIENWEAGNKTPRAEQIVKMAELAPGLLKALGLAGLN